jgi:hypothetical protein
MSLINISICKYCKIYWSFSEKKVKKHIKEKHNTEVKNW